MNNDGSKGRAAARGLAALAAAPLLGAVAQAGVPAAAAAAAPDVADVSVEAQAPARVRPGAAVPFEVTVRNAGPARARNVMITATLPDGAVRTETLGPVQWTSCTRAGETLGCALGSLEAREERTMRITLRTSKGVRPGTVLRAPVRVSTSTRETNLSDNQAQARTTVDAAANAQQGQQGQQDQEGQQGQQGQQGRPPSSKGRPSTKERPSKKYRPSKKDREYFKDRPSSSRD
ncbi:DUF11 domain-containing protein [Spirillospora sp. CA-255316]